MLGAYAVKNLKVLPQLLYNLELLNQVNLRTDWQITLGSMIYDVDSQCSPTSRLISKLSPCELFMVLCRLKLEKLKKNETVINLENVLNIINRSSQTVKCKRTIQMLQYNVGHDFSRAVFSFTVTFGWWFLGIWTSFAWLSWEFVVLHKRVFSHGFSTTQPVKITPDSPTHLQIILETKSSASAQNSQNASVTGSLQLFESQFDSQYISRPPESMISPRIPHDLALCTLFALHHPPITGFNRITGAIYSCSRQPDRLSHCHTNWITILQRTSLPYNSLPVRTLVFATPIRTQYLLYFT